LDELKKEPATSILLLVNILVFLVVDFTGGSENTRHMLNCGAAYTPYILYSHQYYRLFTCMFLHFGMEHLANNMLVLFVLGGRLERTIGKIRFLLVYFLGGICGNILSVYMDLKSGEYAVSAGASGAVFAVLGALIYLIIRRKGSIEGLSTRQILFMAVLAVYLGFAGSGVDNAAHIGGLIGGFLLTPLISHQRKMRNVLP
jgi:rhomboid protease GluP